MPTRVWIDYNERSDLTFAKTIPIDEIHRIAIVVISTSSYEVRMYESGETDDYEQYDVGSDNTDGTYSTMALAQAAVAVIKAL
jgi:hypothetical protein